MSPETMRVEIALDALAQVRAEKFIPTHLHGYIYFPKAISHHPDDQLQKHLTDDRICYGCARGALFLSIIRKHNDLSTGAGLRDCHTVWSDVRWSKEKEFFDLDQIHKIEMAYEGYKYDFYQIYRNPQDRLIAILENIIRNNGTFVPTETTAEAIGV